MTSQVLVPDIGDFTDVPVIEILVAVGDTVEAEQDLLTLESDKATMDIPSPAAGVVKELLVKVGDTVSEGSPLLTIEPGPADAAAVEAAGEAKAGSEAGEPRAVESATAAEAQAAPPGEPPAATPAAPAEPNGDAPPYASPSVRRFARERGVDVVALAGTGRKGRITREDVEAAASGAPAATGGAATPAATERVPLTRIQRLSRDALTKAWQTIPHVTHHEDADITDLEAFRKQLNAEQQDVKITMVALLLKASAATLDAFPRFASSLDGDELILKASRHLGFAADTPEGLIVPVIRDVDHKGLFEIAAELTELSAKARAGKTSPKELSGAVFTISSLGGIGGTGFTPIVNPPQVAILGAVRSATKPVWDGAQFVPRLVLPLSLSYDHRVIDGAAAARFMVHLKATLEDLRRVLL